MPEITPKETEEKTIAKAEKRARELAILEIRIDQHERRLDAINGSVGRTCRAIETLTRVVESSKVPNAAMLSALHKIEEEHEERSKEAREDRRSVKIALYSFVTAVTAAGFGAVFLHYL